MSEPDVKNVTGDFQRELSNLYSSEFNITKFDAYPIIAILNMIKTDCSVRNSPELYKTVITLLQSYNPHTATTKEHNMVIQCLRSLLSQTPDLLDSLITFIPSPSESIAPVSHNHKSVMMKPKPQLLPTRSDAMLPIQTAAFVPTVILPSSSVIRKPQPTKANTVQHAAYQHNGKNTDQVFMQTSVTAATQAQTCIPAVASISPSYSFIPVSIPRLSPVIQTSLLTAQTSVHGSVGMTPYSAFRVPCATAAARCSFMPLHSRSVPSSPNTVPTVNYPLLSKQNTIFAQIPQATVSQRSCSAPPLALRTKPTWCVTPPIAIDCHENRKNVNDLQQTLLQQLQASGTNGKNPVQIIMCKGGTSAASNLPSTYKFHEAKESKRLNAKQFTVQSDTAMATDSGNGDISMQTEMLSSRKNLTNMTLLDLTDKENVGPQLTSMASDGSMTRTTDYYNSIRDVPYLNATAVMRDKLLQSKTSICPVTVIRHLTSNVSVRPACNSSQADIVVGNNARVDRSKKRRKM